MSDLGKVMIILKGEYSAGTPYERLDMVTYEGSSYIAKKNTQGNPPTDTDHWQIHGKGYPGNAAGVDATDVLGLLGTVGADSNIQALIDAVADRVMNQLVSKDRIINNGLTTGEGFALDARQANPNIENTLAYQIAQQNNNSSKWIFLSETTGKEKAYLPDDFNEILVSVVASVNNVIRYSILILKGELSAEEERSFRTGSYSSAQSYAQIVTLATSSYVYLNLYTNTGSDITTNSKVRVYYR